MCFEQKDQNLLQNELYGLLQDDDLDRFATYVILTRRHPCISSNTEPWGYPCLVIELIYKIYKFFIAFFVGSHLFFANETQKKSKRRDIEKIILKFHKIF